MADVTRQQRRQETRAQLKLGHSLLARGLPITPRRDEVIAAARLVGAKLSERNNPRRASEAAQLAHDLAEKSQSANPGKLAIACRRGCHYCCHTFVGILPAEAFLLADAVKSGICAGLTPEMVTTLGAPLEGLSPDERIGRKLACPLLVDGACSAYRVRPLVCRQATSLKLDDCIDEFEGRNLGGRIEISSVHLAHASNAHVVLLAGLRAADLPETAYELASALRIALTVPDAEKRWLDGEDLFADLPQKVARPPEVERGVREIAAALNA
jgi:Fe-S-cluster containining protein